MNNNEFAQTAEPFWTRGRCIGVASVDCVFCRGYGIRKAQGKEDKPCGCVFRAIFRACYKRFRNILHNEAQPGRLSLSATNRAAGRALNYGFPKQEYCADLYLVTKRSLTAEEWKVFDAHYLMGGDWKFCAEKIGIDKGKFFHLLYVIQEKLGRIYAELKPHALYPIDEYFQGMLAKRPVRKSNRVVVTPRNATF